MYDGLLVSRADPVSADLRHLPWPWSSWTLVNIQRRLAAKLDIVILVFTGRIIGTLAMIG